MNKTRIKKVHEIKRGDLFFAAGQLVWKAAEDAITVNVGDRVDVISETHIKVEYEDGDKSMRVFSNPNTQLPITSG